MTPERWQQLDHLFHSALEVAQEKRAAFLREVCAGDDSLLRHVESLISAHEEAGSFIESPALEVEARELAGETAPTKIASGKTISHYEIISPLGSGGMADVYLAQDLTLNRRVALKLLPEYFTRDRDRLRRFQQEARTASSLNHPNIITTYEIGQADDRHFIALEFIDGETLRQNFIDKRGHLVGTPLRTREALDIAIQTADALAAAHEAHIIHRDIKPENIMVRRRDGYVKVLDFGLAKLTEGPVVDVEATIGSLVQTSAGMVMGTANYMSPEQARSEKVDVRTDIWSLGVVLYEMVAGCVPFERATPSEVIALILEREPLPLTRFARDVPAELERIVTKALTKDVEARYQTTKDLLIDLRRLRQRLEIEAEIQRTGEPPDKIGEEAPARGQQRVVVTEKTIAQETRGASVVHPSSGTEYWFTQSKLHRNAGIVLGLLVTIAIGYGIHKLTRRGETALSFQSAKLTRLTTTGKATMAAISPDAKLVVHVVNDGGKRSLWTRQVATQSNIEIVPPAVVTYRGLTFSPDGNYIYYCVSSKNADQIAVFRVSTFGGTPTKLLDDVDGDIDHMVSATVSVSPNGKQIAFLRKGARKETALMIANADGSGERNVTIYQPEDGIGFPKWSPDGRRIAYAVLNYPSNTTTVVEAQVADGSKKPLTSQKWLRIFGLGWLRDGSGLLMLAGRDKFVCQIWHLSLPSGEAHQLTNDLNDYVGMSLAADANTLAVIKMEKQASIWMASNNDTSRAHPVTSGPKADDQVALSPDGGKIVFRSNASGNSDIWIVNADGSNPKQLTTDAGINVGPVVSPDGRHILFLSDRNGVAHIWKMNIEGGDQKQLTYGNGEQAPQFSPDGQWVVYSTIAENSSVWRIPAAGGKPVQLTEKDSEVPTVSPDGKLVACLYKDENAPVRIALIPLEGGRPLKTLDYGAPSAILRWTPDGRAIAYVDPRDTVSNIVARPIDGGAVKQLTDFKTDRTFSFDWSRDGSQLALARGTQASDVILIKYIH
ncbi:MAG TPA: protein kinase [Pyrinomonadaceae bacterium]|nr:protein kinase [Pyrinomonadaceae bacterium]